jgi:hypothetical protein
MILQRPAQILLPGHIPLVGPGKGAQRRNRLQGSGFPFLKGRRLLSVFVLAFVTGYYPFADQ